MVAETRPTPARAADGTLASKAIKPTERARTKWLNEGSSLGEQDGREVSVRHRGRSDLEFTLRAGGIFWLPYGLLRQGLSQVPVRLRRSNLPRR